MVTFKVKHNHCGLCVLLLASLTLQYVVSHISQWETIHFFHVFLLVCFLYEDKKKCQMRICLWSLKFTAELRSLSSNHRWSTYIFHSYTQKSREYKKIGKMFSVYLIVLVQYFIGFLIFTISFKLKAFPVVNIGTSNLTR